MHSTLPNKHYSSQADNPNQPAPDPPYVPEGCESDQAVLADCLVGGCQHTQLCQACEAAETANACVTQASHVSQLQLLQADKALTQGLQATSMLVSGT